MHFMRRQAPYDRSAGDALAISPVDSFTFLWHFENFDKRIGKILLWVVWSLIIRMCIRRRIWSFSVIIFRSPRVLTILCRMNSICFSPLRVVTLLWPCDVTSVVQQKAPQPKAASPGFGCWLCCWSSCVQAQGLSVDKRVDDVRW